MATRKIKDAKDLTTNELIYFKGHAKATYMSNGKTVEDAINQIGTGGGGGGGVATETDPVFSASPAASITEEKKAEWDSKMDKVTLAAVATSGSYNDLLNKPTIPSAVTESTVSGWGFTKNAGTYSKPSAGIPKTDLESAVQISLGKADTALQHTEVGDLKTIAMANAVETDGLLYAFPDQATGDEDDILLSGGTVKTINGQDLLVDENSNDIITTYEHITTSSSSVELLPNTIIEWPVPIQFQELVLTFGKRPLQGYAFEYIARFTVSSDGVQLIVPDNVVWADGVYPAMTKGKTYEISFMDGYATFLEF